MAACIVLLFTPGSAAQAPSGMREGSHAETAGLVVQNVGQWDPAARFQVWGGPGVVWLAEDAIWVSLPGSRSPVYGGGGSQGQARATEAARRQGAALRLSFAGANPQARLEPFGPSQTRISYFYGNEPANWQPDVPVWSGVRYVDLYPGLDLEVSGSPAGWHWRLVAREGVLRDTSAIRLEVQGADDLSLEGGGLRARTALGNVSIPLLQLVDDAGVPVEPPGGGPQVAADGVESPFTPVATRAAPSAATSQLRYSTLLGGNNYDGATDVAVDGAGQAYVTGWTYSADFPTSAGVYDAVLSGGYDLFVSALNADGTALVYSTFVGGNGWDDSTGIALDGAGRAYITGYTDSPDFPTTTGAYDRSLQGDNDAFVTVLNATGTGLVYSTLFGGSRWDDGMDIALDAAGRACIVGETSSDNLPTTAGAYATSDSGANDVYVSVFDPSGSALVYCTYLGGSGWDDAMGIAVDADGQAYVTGYSESADFPTTPGAFGLALRGTTDAFVTALNASGSALLYSTYLGGAGSEEANGIAVDALGQAHVTGMTSSADLPTTAGVLDSALSGGTDAFVAALNAQGSELVCSTYLGGGSNESAARIALEQDGRLCITGYTESAGFPTTAGAYDTALAGGDDAFVSVLNPTATALLYSTYLGGSGYDDPTGLALDGAGGVYVAGYTDSNNYPTTAGAYDSVLNGEYAAYVSALQLPSAGVPFELFLPWVQGGGADRG